MKLETRLGWLILLVLAWALSSCTTSPKVKRNADGSYVVDAGGTFMASRTGVIAEVKTREGDHIKYVAKSEDSTKVPISFLRTAATALMGYFWNASNEAAEATAQAASNNATKAAIETTKADAAVKLGEQSTSLGLKKLELEATQ